MMSIEFLPTAIRIGCVPPAVQRGKSTAMAIAVDKIAYTAGELVSPAPGIQRLTQARVLIRDPTTAIACLPHPPSKTN